METLRRFPPWARKSIGISLIILGCFGFLPILGFWMIPLGLVVLSADYRLARRMHIRIRWLIRRFRRRFSSSP